jgi:hypothetical protein
MDLMEDLFDTNMYQSANAEDKAELIEKVYEYSREEAKYTFFNNRGISYTNSTKDGVAYYKESNVKGAIENDMLPEEYDFYKEYPGKYAVSKSVGGYTKYKEYSKAFSDITADKDANGKTISGSRKDKVIDYINDLDVDYGQKLILFKSEYPADDSYNEEIVNYLVGRNDISRDDTISILTTLGFSVSSDGRVSW